jgi:hypothetical protein
MSRHDYDVLREFHCALQTLEKLYVEKVQKLEKRIEETVRKSQGVKS